MNVGALTLRIGASALATIEVGADEVEAAGVGLPNVAGARFSTVMPTLDGLTKVLRTNPPLAAVAGAKAVALGRAAEFAAGRLAIESLFSLDTAEAAGGAATEVDDDETEARTPATLMVGASSLDLLTIALPLEETEGLTTAESKQDATESKSKRHTESYYVSECRGDNHTWKGKSYPKNSRDEQIRPCRSRAAAAPWSPRPRSMPSQTTGARP
jgi:hypothetical protein